MRELSEKDYKTYKTLAIFGGFLGLHKFYLGKIFEGIVYLFTFGMLGILWLVDAIQALTNKSCTDKNMRLLIHPSKMQNYHNQVQASRRFNVEFKVAGTFTDEHTQNIKSVLKQERREAEDKKELWQGLSDSEIKSMADPEDRYFEFDTSWSFINAPRLVPEPYNQYDPNAIAVYINDKRVGYVPKDQIYQVRDVMHLPSYKSFTLYGGRYKRYDEKLRQVVIEESGCDLLINLVKF